MEIGEGAAENVTGEQPQTIDMLINSYKSSASYQEHFGEGVTEIAMLIRRKTTALQKLKQLESKKIPLKRPEPPRRKTTWDFLLEEASWLANDFHGERVWKIVNARELAKGCKIDVFRRKRRNLKSRKHKRDASSLAETLAIPSSKCSNGNIYPSRTINDSVKLAQSICSAVFGSRQLPHLSYVESLRTNTDNKQTTPWSLEHSFAQRTSFSVKFNALPKAIVDSLRSYQVAALQWWWSMMSHNLGAVFGDERGLGKRVIAVCAMMMVHKVLAEEDSVRKSGKDSKSLLIVCPHSLIFHWVNEIKSWAPGLRVNLDLNQTNGNDITIASPTVLREKLAYSVNDDFELNNGPKDNLHKISSPQKLIAGWDMVTLDLTLGNWTSDDMVLGWSAIRSHHTDTKKNDSNVREDLIPPWRFLYSIEPSRRLCLVNRNVTSSPSLGANLLRFLLPTVEQDEKTRSEEGISYFVLRRKIADDGIAPQLPLPYTQTVMCSASSAQQAATKTLTEACNKIKMTCMDDSSSAYAKFQQLFQWLAAAHAVAQHPGMISTWSDEGSTLMEKFSGVFGGVHSHRTLPIELQMSFSFCPSTFVVNEWWSCRQYIRCNMSATVKAVSSSVLQPEWTLASLLSEERAVGTLQKPLDPQNAMTVSNRFRSLAISSSLINFQRLIHRLRINDVWDMSGLVDNIYDRSLPIVDNLRAHKVRISSTFSGVPKKHYIPATSLTSQLPRLGVEDYTALSGKFRALHNILAEARSYGEKTLLMTSLPQLAVMLQHFLSTSGICYCLLNEQEGDKVLPVLSSTAIAEFDSSQRIKIGIIAIPGCGNSNSGSFECLPSNSSLDSPWDGSNKFGDINIANKLPISASVAVIMDVCMIPSVSNTLANVLDKITSARSMRILQLATIGTLEEACLNIWSGAVADNSFSQVGAGSGHPGLKVHEGNGGMHSYQLTSTDRDEDSYDTNLLEYRSAYGDAAVSRREARLRAIQNATNDTDKWSTRPEQDRNNVVSHGLLSYTNGMTPKLLAVVDVGSLLVGDAGALTSEDGKGSSKVLEGLLLTLTSIEWGGGRVTVEHSRVFFENCLMDAFIPAQYRATLLIDNVEERMGRAVRDRQNCSFEPRKLVADADKLRKRKCDATAGVPMVYEVRDSRMGSDTVLMGAAAMAKPPSSPIGPSVDVYRMNRFHRGVVEKLASVVEVLSSLQDEGILHFSRLFGPPNPEVKAVCGPWSVAEPARAFAVKHKFDALRKRVGVFQHATRLKAGQRNALPAIGKGAGAALTMIHSLSQCHRVPADSISDLISLQKESPGEHQGKGNAGGGSGSMGTSLYGIADGCNSDFSISRMWCNHLLAPPSPASNVPKTVVRTIPPKERYIETANQSSLSVTTRCVSFSSAAQLVRRVRTFEKHKLKDPAEKMLKFVMRSMGVLGGTSFSPLLFSHVQQAKPDMTAHNFKKLHLLPSAVNRASFPIGLACSWMKGSMHTNSAPLVQGSHRVRSVLCREKALHFVSQIDESPPSSFPGSTRDGWDPWEDYLLLSLFRDFGSNLDFINTAFQHHPFIRIAVAEAAARNLGIGGHTEMGTGGESNSNLVTPQPAFDLGRNRARGVNSIYYRHRRIVASQLPHGFWGLLAKRDAFLAASGKAYEMYPPDMNALGQTPRKYLPSINDHVGPANLPEPPHPSPLTIKVTATSVRSALQSRIESPSSVNREELESSFDKAPDLAAAWEEEIQKAGGRDSDPKKSGPSHIYGEYVNSKKAEPRRMAKDIQPFKLATPSVIAAKNNRNRASESASRASAAAAARGPTPNGGRKHTSGASSGTRPPTDGSLSGHSGGPRLNFTVGSTSSSNTSQALSSRALARSQGIALNLPSSGPAINLPTIDSTLGTSHPSLYGAAPVTVSSNEVTEMRSSSSNGSKKIARPNSRGSGGSSRKRPNPDASSSPSASASAKKRKQNRSRRGGSSYGSRPAGAAPQSPVVEEETASPQVMATDTTDYQQWLATLYQDKELAPKIEKALLEQNVDDETRAANIEQIVKDHYARR